MATTFVSPLPEAIIIDGVHMDPRSRIEILFRSFVLTYNVCWIYCGFLGWNRADLEMKPTTLSFSWYTQAYLLGHLRKSSLRANLRAMRKIATSRIFYLGLSVSWLYTIAMMRVWDGRPVSSSVSSTLLRFVLFSACDCLVVITWSFILARMTSDHRDLLFAERTLRLHCLLSCFVVMTPHPQLFEETTREAYVVLFVVYMAQYVHLWVVLAVWEVVHKFAIGRVFHARF